MLAEAVPDLPPPFAVRSSAVDEDGKSASFAGQHLTVLNVHSAADIPDAVREVWWSANSDAAITYRQRVGLMTRQASASSCRRCLNPTVAGVMFTENPVTGADERLIEASWGLGEAVVAGLVVPTSFASIARARCWSARRDASVSRFARCPTAARSKSRWTPRRQAGSASTTANSPRWANWRFAARRSTARAATSNGPSRTATLYLLQCRAVTTGKAQSAPPPPARRDPTAIMQRVDLFAGMDRRQTEQIGRLLKERRFKQGETVIMEGTGGAAFFVIESGEASVSNKGVERPGSAPATISARSP